MPAPEAIPITLDATELRIALTVATDRQIENLAKGRDPEGRPEELGWAAHFEGACGELAVAQWAGVYWNGNLGKLKAPDVARVEVKTTARHNGCLLVQKPKLVHERAYILVTGTAPNLALRGWAYGYEIGQDKYWDATMRRIDHEALHRKISEAAQKYHDLATTEPFPRPQWIDAWNELKEAIAQLRAATKPDDTIPKN